MDLEDEVKLRLNDLKEQVDDLLERKKELKNEYLSPAERDELDEINQKLSVAEEWLADAHAGIEQGIAP